MLTRVVAPGIHRVEDAHTDWYLVEDDGAVAIVDAGVPHTSWPLLHEALRRLGRTASDLRALVLTHAHLDHIGFAERARRELGLPVPVHREEVPRTRRPRDYRRERAVVTLNPYTGGHGPQLVARAATADTAQAFSPLDAVAGTDAQTVLTGHGEPWQRAAAAMADEARRAGVS